MEFDIFNVMPRQIICTRNEDNKFFGCDKNSPKLTIGKIYNYEYSIIHSSYTEIFLEEFKNIPFNSVCFSEFEKI